jgi:hypothetical protein
MADTRVCHTPTDITRPARATLCGARVVQLVVCKTRSRPLTRMRVSGFREACADPGNADGRLPSRTRVIARSSAHSERNGTSIGEASMDWNRAATSELRRLRTRLHLIE